MTSNRDIKKQSNGSYDAQRQKNRRNKKVVVGLLFLATFPVSFPLWAVRAIKRKQRKAKVATSIRRSDETRARAQKSEVVQTNVSRDSEHETSLLSLIMPIYNVESYVETSVISVLNQDYSNIELILVNDASSDQSTEIARMFEQIDDRVTVVDLPFNTPGGAGIPSNIGIEHASGEFVGFVDADDFVCRSSFSALMQAASDQKSDLTIGLFKTFDDDTKRVENAIDTSLFADIPENQQIRPADYPFILQSSPVPWRKIYKKSFIDEHDIRFPEGDFFFEDNPLHWDAITAAGSMTFVNAVVSYYRLNRNGQTGTSNPIRLSAFLQHMTRISQIIRHRNAKFAWQPFLEFATNHSWVVERQLKTSHVEHFKMRFRQVVDEHIVPFLESQKVGPLQKTKLKIAYGTSKKPADLSLVIHHDEAEHSGEDLNKTLNSIGNPRNVKVETLLLTRDETPFAYDADPNILCFPTEGKKSRSLNEAIQLCSGRYIVFLNSGDFLDDAIVDHFEEALKNKGDIVQSNKLNLSSQMAPSSAMYSRRLVQDNAILFGPSSHGFIAFELLCSLYAQNVQNVESPLIHRTKQKTPWISADQMAREAGELARLSITRDLSQDQRAEISGAVSKLFDEIAGAGRGNPDLERARRYASEQFAIPSTTPAKAL